MAVATIARRVLATGAIAGTALLALTVPASAHTYRVTPKCNDDASSLTVDLSNYNGGVANTVKVTVDNQPQADESFKSSWKKSWEGLDNTKEHTYTVTVKAGDDPDGSHNFSFSKSGTIESCVDVPPPTTTTTEAPTTTPTTTTTTTTATPVPTTSPAATPPADQGGLANTGASVGLPLGIGALLLVGGGALLLVVRKRRSAA